MGSILASSLSLSLFPTDDEDLYDDEQDEEDEETEEQERLHRVSHVY